MSKRTEALLETIQGTDLWERSELGFQKRSGDKKRTGWGPGGAELKRFRRQFPGTRVSQRTAGYQVRQVEVRMETRPLRLRTITFKETMGQKSQIWGRLGRKVTRKKKKRKLETADRIFRF